MINGERLLRLQMKDLQIKLLKAQKNADLDNFLKLYPTSLETAEKIWKEDEEGRRRRVANEKENKNEGHILKSFFSRHGRYRGPQQAHSKPNLARWNNSS